SARQVALREQRLTEVKKEPLHLQKEQSRWREEPTRSWEEATGPRSEETGSGWRAPAEPRLRETASCLACLRESSPTTPPYLRPDGRWQRYRQIPKLAGRNRQSHARH